MRESLPAADSSTPEISIEMVRFLGAVATAANLADTADEAMQPRPDFLDAIGQVGLHLGRVFERQESGEAIRDSEQRLRQILNSAGDAFIAMNADGCITDWNDESQRIFGWARDEVLGR